jgi:predicted nucleotidyltransferase
MSNISLDLSNKLPAEQVNIIRYVVRAAESQGLRLFIVGAQARDLLLLYVYDLPVHRATNDIDFGIIVESWDEFTKLRDDLIVDKKFQPHRTMRQRLVHESGLLIDLVPFGDLEEVSGQISWPPDFSVVMSTVGFREAYDNSVEVRIADDLIVRVASLPGLALMKIVAWDDRRFERDAQDLGLIMRHYLDAGNQDRVYSKQGDCFDLLNEEFDYEKASARILGRDIGRLVTDISRPILERVLPKGPDQENLDALATLMIRNSANYYGDYDMALSMLTELRTGMSESDRF